MPAWRPDAPNSGTMAADQAAGLRRRRAAGPPRCIHLVSASSEPAQRLLRVLGAHGLETLLIDTQGRLFAAAPRSLFDWRQQLARQQLHTLPMAGGRGWHAPGLSWEAPGFDALATRYDCLVLDQDVTAPTMPGLPQRGQVVMLEVASASLRHAYAWLKTLSHAGAAPEIVLFGEAATGARLLATSRNFLDAAFVQKIGDALPENDAFAALAVRIAGEETGRPAVA